MTTTATRDYTALAEAVRGRVDELQGETEEQSARYNKRPGSGGTLRAGGNV